MTGPVRAAVRREAPAVAAVIVAVVGVLAPLTLGGRLASSADLDAFYAPFATFLHDRLAAGDIPYWAPGAFSGQPFLADAQSGVTYPPMLLASWLLGPIDALRAVATFHYLIAALGTYALARQLGRAARARPSARSRSRPRATSWRARPRSGCSAARPGSRRRSRSPRPTATRGPRAGASRSPGSRSCSRCTSRADRSNSPRSRSRPA